MYGFEIKYRSCILVLAILEKSDWEIREIGGRKLTTTLCACNQITRRRRRRDAKIWTNGSLIELHGLVIGLHHQPVRQAYAFLAWELNSNLPNPHQNIFEMLRTINGDKSNFKVPLVLWFPCTTLFVFIAKAKTNGYQALLQLASQVRLRWLSQN